MQAPPTPWAGGGFPIPAGAPGGLEDRAPPVHRLDLCLPRSPTPSEGCLHCFISLWEDPCLDLENGCRESICQAQKTKLASPANDNLESAQFYKRSPRVSRRGCSPNE